MTASAARRKPNFGHRAETKNPEVNRRALAETEINTKVFVTGICRRTEAVWLRSSVRHDGIRREQRRAAEEVL